MCACWHVCMYVRVGFKRKTNQKRVCMQRGARGRPRLRSRHRLLLKPIPALHLGNTDGALPRVAALKVTTLPSPLPLRRTPLCQRSSPAGCLLLRFKVQDCLLSCTQQLRKQTLAMKCFCLGLLQQRNKNKKCKKHKRAETE